MGSPRKKGVKGAASPRQSKTSSSQMGILVSAGLLLVACAVIFSLGLWMGMNSAPPDMELDSPANDHLLRVSGHSPFAFSKIKLQEAISSKSAAALSKLSTLKHNTFSISGSKSNSAIASATSIQMDKNSLSSVDSLLSQAIDTSTHDALMNSLFAHDSASEKTHPPLLVTPKVEPKSEPVKLDTLENRKASMKREPIVITQQEIVDRQEQIKKQEDVQGEAAAVEQASKVALRQQQENQLYKAAVSAVGEEIVQSAPPTWRLSLGEDVNFASVVKQTIHNINSNSPGPIETFVKNGGRFPIAVLAANRPDMLQQTLQNLLKVNGARKEDILIFQDGSDGSVASVARSMGFDPIQHISPAPRVRGAKPDGAVLIAAQYKFALSRAMELRPHAPGVIIVEDDFLFSPDFLEYFHHTSPILERDDTTFILSAWNDNGLKGKVSDRSALCRTMFFPGLGWLLPRRLWEQELSSKWPKEHWDHWLRDPKRHKNRESVYPEVNRDYHAGKKGTFMDDYHHNRYFKDIDYDLVQTQTLTSNSGGGVHVGEGSGSDPTVAFKLNEVPTYVWGMNQVYEARILAIINSQRTLHVSDLEQLSDLEQYSEAIVWHRTEFKVEVGNNAPPFKAMADYFNIWHEWPRTAHAGSVHQFRWGSSHTLVLLVNLRHFMDGRTGESRYAKYRPITSKVFEPADFSNKQPPLPLSITKHLKILKSSNQGESCTLTCKNFNGYQCEARAFSVANTCAQMKNNFPCERGCEESYGKEQPAYVFKGAPEESLPGACLYTSKPAESSCEASHPLTTRLCPCVPPA